MTSVQALLTLLGTAEGGRAREVLLDGAWFPHVRVGDGEMLGVGVSAPDVLALAPGEGALVDLRFLYEQLDYSALRPGAVFAVLEGPRTVGYGKVLAA